MRAARALILVALLLSACADEARVEISLHCGLDGVLLEFDDDASRKYGIPSGSWTFDAAEVAERRSEWASLDVSIVETVSIVVRSDGDRHVAIGPDGSTWRLVPPDPSRLFGCV